jgi:hypothetical protein
VVFSTSYLRPAVAQPDEERTQMRASDFRAADRTFVRVPRPSPSRAGAGQLCPSLNPSWLKAAIPECHRRGDETPEMAAHSKCLRNLALRQRVD